MRPILSLIILATLSCSNIEDTPELVDKLRAFGFQTDQPTYTHSEESNPVTATITFLVASNSATELEIGEFDLPDIEQVDLVFGQVSRQDFSGGLSIFSIETTATIPNSEQLDFSPIDDSASINFALRVTQGAEEEVISSRLRIYRPEDPRLSLTAQTIEITSPLPGATLAPGTIDLKAELGNTSEQPYRISWLVSSGVVERPRSIETEWEIEESGPQTIIATSRGLSNYTMSFSVLELTIDGS